MTTNEQAAAIAERTSGTNEGFVDFDGLTVKIRVVDSRKSFGRDDIKVTPVGGSGEKWIDLNRLNKGA